MQFASFYVQNLVDDTYQVKHYEDFQNGLLMINNPYKINFRDIELFMNQNRIPMLGSKFVSSLNEKEIEKI